MKAQLLLLSPLLHGKVPAWDELLILIPGVLILAVIWIVAAWTSKNKEQNSDD